jgi:tetratricopeptide (TPR) repeat protein
LPVIPERDKRIPSSVALGEKWRSRVMDESEARMAALQAIKDGQGFLQSGEHEQALAAFTRGEALFGRIGDRGLQARAGTNKALVLVHLKRFEEALAGFREALQNFEQGEDLIRVAEQWGNIGSVHRDMGQPEEALPNYAKALAIYRELGQTERAADQCTNIAYALFVKREYPESLGWYREAISFYAAAGSEQKRALTAENVARLEAALAEAAE